MRTIKVCGTGRVSEKPNSVVIAMSLKSEDAEYSRVIELSAYKIGALSGALFPLGIVGDRIKTSRFEIDTRYDSVKERDGRYKRVFRGYCATQCVSIELDLDMKLLSDVLAAIAACPANPEFSISFTVKDKDALKDALLRSAAENAISRAQLLANASGVTLGELLSIDYSWGEINIVSPTDFELVDKCVAKESAIPDITPEDIKLTENVTFVWEIK